MRGPTTAVPISRLADITKLRLITAGLGLGFADALWNLDGRIHRFTEQLEVQIRGDFCARYPPKQMPAYRLRRIEFVSWCTDERDSFETKRRAKRRWDTVLSDD